MRATDLRWDGDRLVIELHAPRPTSRVRLSERESGVWRDLAPAQATVVLDAGSVLDGAPLTRGVWDITTSDDGSGDTGEPLPAPAVEPAILVRDGLVLIAYCNNAEHLSVDVGGSIRSIAGSSLVEVPDVDLTGRPHDEGMSIRLRMPRLTGHGAARVPSQLWLSKQMSFPGELVSDESGNVWFEASRLWVPPGRFRIGGRFGDRGGWTRLDLEVGRRGDHQVLLR